MTKVLAFADKNIIDGDYNSSSTVSIFGTPGSGTMIRGYYYCNIAIGMAICEESDKSLSLYLAPRGGTISAGTKIGSNRADWTPILYSYPDQFYAYWPVGGGLSHYLGAAPPGGEHIYADTVFSGAVSSTSSGGTSGSVSYTIPTANQCIIGQEPPSGWVKVNAWTTTSGTDPVTRSAWVWLSGAVSYGTPTNDDVWMSSTKIQIDSTEILDILFDYFPWERRISGTWYSLNREGPRSTTAGLFRLNGTWTPCTNQQSGSNNHGFRYNNGWQRSPKSGQGA